MKHYRPIVHIAVFIIIVLISFQNQYNPFVMDDVTQVATVMKDVDYEENPLYKKLVQVKKKKTQSPQNAWVDPVWKKTPARNGITVDVNQSFQAMKEKDKYDPSLLVYEQMQPEVTLEDLPAAPIYRGHPDKQMVSFLINVSWGTEHIPELLEILNKHNIKATFFVEGEWAKEHSDLLQMIDEEDHIIGNHAYDHPDMQHLSKEENEEQVKQTNDIIKAITGEMPKWFAPPSGSYNSEVVGITNSLEMETVLWTVDTIDWKKPSTSVMVDNVMENIHPGATILMHPTKVMVDGLDELIKAIKKENYQFGSIEKLVSPEREQVKEK